MKIINVVGARPNFMKIAPIHRSMSFSKNLESVIVHTGQHYDEKMSKVFFEQLELPKPDYFLGVGGGSHTYQTANIMLRFEEILKKEQPDAVLVVGDVNSTIACGLVAVKMGLPLAHVEAGLRSGDREMPEEVNRILTDSISNFLFVTEQSGMINLAKEGIPDEKVFFVGNVMIDSLVYFLEKAKKTKVLDQNNLSKEDYILMTMHRPKNVDNEEGIKNILAIIKMLLKEKKVVFPIHPRTANNFHKFHLFSELEKLDNLLLLPPQGYLEFLNLIQNATLLITDSGGIQEETTFLKVACLTLRESTERPVTIDLGTNQLHLDLNPKAVFEKVEGILCENERNSVVPSLWDGHAAQRIVSILEKRLVHTS